MFSLMALYSCLIYQVSLNPHRGRTEPVLDNEC